MGSFRLHDAGKNTDYISSFLDLHHFGAFCQKIKTSPYAAAKLILEFFAGYLKNTLAKDRVNGGMDGRIYAVPPFINPPYYCSDRFIVPDVAPDRFMIAR